MGEIERAGYLHEIEAHGLRSLCETHEFERAGRLSAKRQRHAAVHLIGDSLRNLQPLVECHRGEIAGGAAR